MPAASDAEHSHVANAARAGSQPSSRAWSIVASRQPTPLNRAERPRGATLDGESTVAGPSPPTESGAEAPAVGSYSGGVYHLFFNSKAMVSSFFRRDPDLPPGIPTAILGSPYSGDDPAAWLRRSVGDLAYFSYRNRLPLPLSNGADHDAGWGCMVRTGQMMLCAAISRAMPELPPGEVRALFHDTPTAPFGLHAMTDAGQRHLVPVGEWFNPTCLSYSLRELVAAYPPTAARLAVVAGRDGAVARADLAACFAAGRQALVVVPLMVGLEAIPPGYDDAVSRTFHIPHSLGIVGGRPKHSMYFVGSQGPTLFYLDPHIVQAAFTSRDSYGGGEALRGFAAVSELDPCMLQCYLLRGPDDCAAWEAQLERELNNLSEFPMFTISERARRAPPAAPRVGPPGAGSSQGRCSSDGPVDDCQFSDDSDGGAAGASASDREPMGSGEPPLAHDLGGGAPV